jgi:hypothetical protein
MIPENLVCDRSFLNISFVLNKIKQVNLIHPNNTKLAMDGLLSSIELYESENGSGVVYINSTTLVAEDKLSQEVQMTIDAGHKQLLIKFLQIADKEIINILSGSRCIVYSRSGSILYLSENYCLQNLVLIVSSIVNHKILLVNEINYWLTINTVNYWLEVKSRYQELLKAIHEIILSFSCQVFFATKNEEIFHIFSDFDWGSESVAIIKMQRFEYPGLSQITVTGNELKAGYRKSISF